MHVLPRAQFGDPILKKKAKRVPRKEVRSLEFQKQIKELLYTMRRSGGVGLAAPQVGISSHFAVMELKGNSDTEKPRGPVTIINPKIIDHSKEMVTGWEGCLSFKGVRGNVPRWKKVTVEYTNTEGERVVEKASGWWARIFNTKLII